MGKKGKERKVRIYLNQEVSKSQREWIDWYELGSDDWFEAYYQYPSRRKSLSTNLKKEKSWFNRVLSSLHEIGAFRNVTYAFISQSGICWKHPGFSNDGYVAEALEKDMPNYLLERTKII